MYIEQLYTGCLAEAAYYIESEGEAVIIDPLRETEPYIQLAARRKSTIKYVFETHFHADFVSGHVDLAKKTNSTIVYGPTAQPGYVAHIATDGENFKIGKITIKVLHTPGHTPESSCYLLIDENGKNHAIFTGDTLFVGDVGRPDLAVKSDLTQDDLAGMLYESLQSKIMPLANEVIVYPGHGAGSSCGKNIGKETHSTIGIQKQTNYALQPMSKAEFVKAVTDGLSEPPKYFFMDAGINKNGYDSIDEVMQRNLNLVGAEEFSDLINSGKYQVLDARHQDVFEKGYIKDAINIGLDGQYAIWVGTLIDPKLPILLVTDNNREAEAVLRLARVGYENVKAVLKGGIDTWIASGKSVETITSISPAEFVKLIEKGIDILDVRKKGEQESGVIENARLICLSNLQKQLPALDKNTHYYVHCAGGYRSMMAVSLMKKEGFKHLTNISGGMAKIKETGIKLVQPELV